MDIMLREFGRYVRDRHRTDVFSKAIADVVSAGDVVADLGTGFGLLAMMAVRAGARHVYAIEQGPYLELARATAADNGIGRHITWIAGNSVTVSLPEQVDVIISETLGQIGLEEFIVEYLADAINRFGKPRTKVMPSAIFLHATPVQMPSLRDNWRERYGACWKNAGGFDLSRLRQVVFENDCFPYTVCDTDSTTLALAAPATLAEFTIGLQRSSEFVRTAICTITDPGILDGWLVSFSARLSDKSTISTALSEPATHWRRAVFPIVPPQAVSALAKVSAAFGFHRATGWSFVPQTSAA